MKDTYTKMKEKHAVEAKKMVREATIICGTIIVLTVAIIIIGIRIT
jgi:hypothetical protein